MRVTMLPAMAARSGIRETGILPSLKHHELAKLKGDDVSEKKTYPKAPFS